MSRPTSYFIATISLCSILLAASSRILADDWPQWRGPHRDAASAETGLLQAWPAGGPKAAWHAAGLGTGYSSVAIGGGRLFTQGRHEADVIVTALDEHTGQLAWSKKIGETSRHPSSTPTLDDDRLYVLDPDGDLVCLTAATGEIVWQTNLIDNLAGRMMSGRGYGESPLIDGDRLICTPGGPETAMVALNKLTGVVIWKARLPELGVSGRDGAGFSSIVVTEAAGLRQYVQLMGRGLVGINAEDGRFLWGYNNVANNTANIPTPIVQHEFVFAANGYSAGSVLLKLVANANPTGALPEVKADAVYDLSASQFQNHHGGVVHLGEHLFGGHGNNNGLPSCLEFKTGRVLWKRRGPGIGSAAVVAADGQLYFRYQNGLVALIEASPSGYKLNGSFEIPGAGGDSWAHPAIANGHLYLREQNLVWVYDIRRKAMPSDSAALAKSIPIPGDLLAKCQKQGLSIESLTFDPQKHPHSYDYAWGPVGKLPHGAAYLVTLNNTQLSPQGTIQSEELLDLLAELPRPLIVNLAGTQFSDAGLEQIRRLNFNGLNLELCNRVTDAGLNHLTQIQNLHVIILTGTSVTPIGLKYLTPHTKLLALDLELCDGITDDACKALGEMKQLKLLNLKKSGFEKRSITDAGLQQLQNLAELEVLNLYGNKVTDAGLVHLQPFRKLQELNLSLMGISDAGLKHLRPLTSLQHLELLYSEGFAGPTLSDGLADSLEPLTGLTTLNLTGAKLTDAGLKRLHVLKNLSTLQLVRTRVTSAGIQAFQGAIPACKVVQ